MNATREHCVRISKKNASGESIGTLTLINTCVVYSISCLVLRCAPTSLLVIIVHAVVSLRLGGVDGPSCAKFDLRASAWVCPWQPAATRNRLRIHRHDSIAVDRSDDSEIQPPHNSMQLADLIQSPLPR